MRILRISLQNLASLEGTHTVDFTQEPLRSAGLFSICGPTGSGKSTLLDALCLALYERTPRLDSARGAALPDGSATITQRDPANLLRRGTGEGFAEVAFIGVDGATWTARWSVRRARLRAEGALQATEVTLFRGDVAAGAEGVPESAGKKSEVLPAIRAKIGLSYEQFTRAVLLAQNDFAAFLKAEDRERAEILQALTGTERFGQISIAVYARAAAEKKAVAAIEYRLAGAAPLPAEARAEAEREAAAAEAAWQAVLREIAAREKEALWFTRAAELSREVQKSEHELAAARQAQTGSAPRRAELRRTEEISRSARPLREAELRLVFETATAGDARRTAAERLAAATAERQSAQAASEKVAGLAAQAQKAWDEAQAPLREARTLGTQLAPLRARLTSLEQERTEIEEHRLAVVRKRDSLVERQSSAAAEQAALAPKIERLLPLAPFAGDAAAWRDRLALAAAAQQSLLDAEREAARCAEAEEQQRVSIGEERARDQPLREALETAAAALQTAQAAAERGDAAAIVRSRSEQLTVLAALQQIEKALLEEQALAARLQTGREEWSAGQVRQQEVVARARELAQQIPLARKAVESLRAALELARAAVDDAAVALRENLAAGAPCPVCGAVAHPYAAHPPSAETAALRALAEEVSRQEKHHAKLAAEEAALRQACELHVKEEAVRNEALATLTARLHAARAARPTHALWELPEPEQTAALAALFARANEALLAVEKEDASHRAAQNERERCRTEWDLAREAHALSVKKLNEATLHFATLESRRQTSEIARQQKLMARQQAFADLAELFSALPALAAAHDEAPAPARDRFFAETQELLALQSRLVALEADGRESAAALVPLAEALARTEEELRRRNQEIQALRLQHEELSGKRAALFGGQPADPVEAHLQSALQAAFQAREDTGAKLTSAATQSTAFAAALTAAESALAGLQQQAGQARSRMDQWLAAHPSPELDRAALDAVLLRDHAWFTAEQAALEALDSRLQQATGALAAHESSLAAHRLTRPTAEEAPSVQAALESLRVLQAQAETRRDLARTSLKADDTLRETAATFTRALEERRTAAHPWERLNELIGSADGAKFRNLAQRRTLDLLLRYTNRQLEMLSSRYRLERLPESLNLLVVDHDMADERRSVHSLSGGESFLLSLALALGLASLTSNRLRIESLFIDEGFGSLDPETLGVAMGALLQLEAQGRKVGVISHVSEMAEAIPVQIRVEKGRSGASRLTGAGVAAREVLILSGACGEGSGEERHGALAEKALALLLEEQSAGRLKVSVTALRKSLDCTLAELEGARRLLGDRIVADGRSLRLAATA